MELNIFLPGPVRPKGRPRVTRKGIAYTPEKTRVYEAALASAAYDAMGGLPPLRQPLAVALVAVLAPSKSWPAWKRKAALAMQVAPTGTPDLDNLAKTMDALNGIVWADDSYVVDMVLRKRYGTCPGLHVLIRPVTKLSAQGSKRTDLEALERERSES